MQADSAAAAAGLQAQDDYIIGTPDLVFNSGEDLYGLVEAAHGKELRFYIYNSQSDDVRLVFLTPTEVNGRGRFALRCNAAVLLMCC